MTQTAVEELLVSAWAAVDAANVPEDLRPIAFTKALDLLTGTTKPSAPSGGGDTDGSESVLSDDERINKIAQRTGADASKLPYVYDLDDDDANVIVKRSKLGSGDAAATRELALLYCAARQAADYGAQTGIDLIRTRVEDMGVLDGANFSKHIKGIEGMTVKGSGNARECKVTQHGFEEAGKLIARITGGGS